MKIEWRRYYFRVAGFALSGAGLGLIMDELVHGPFRLTPLDHEFWGVVIFIVGLILIARKPHGKD